MTGALETDDHLGRPERGIVLTIAFWKSYEEANVDSQGWLVYKFMTATQKASKKSPVPARSLVQHKLFD
jgi:hypothetical protein